LKHGKTFCIASILGGIPRLDELTDQTLCEETGGAAFFSKIGDGWIDCDPRGTFGEFRKKRTLFLALERVNRIDAIFADPYNAARYGWRCPFGLGYSSLPLRS
jgi:hypothetical protein